MGDIERKFWLTRAPKSGGGWMPTIECDHYRHALGWEVEGPFVPESQLREAVADARMAVEWGEFVRREAAGYWGKDQEAVLERFRAAAGGQ
jgi:hypothetical protein